MTKVFDLSESKRPDKGVSILANAVEQTFEPVFRDKFASQPEPWATAYDLMVKAKIITPLNDRGFDGQGAPPGVRLNRAAASSPDRSAAGFL